MRKDLDKLGQADRDQLYMLELARRDQPGKLGQVGKVQLDKQADKAELDKLEETEQRDKPEGEELDKQFADIAEQRPA